MINVGGRYGPFHLYISFFVVSSSANPRIRSLQKATKCLYLCPPAARRYAGKVPTIHGAPVYACVPVDRKSTRLNSSHPQLPRMPSSA